MRIAIRAGHLVDPANGVDRQADLFIAEGKVVAVGRMPDGFAPEREIDASGQVVCPGLVDLQARLREPGEEHKADIASETRAAARAGITTLCCPPDTQPVIDTPAVVELIHRRAESSGLARVFTLGALTHGLAGKQLSEMQALRQAGCLGLSNALEPVADTLVMRRALEYAAGLGMTVFLFAEDPWLRGQGCAHEGAVSTRLGLPGIPEIAETIAVARDLALVEQTGVRAHFCQLSSRKAVRKLARARHDGLPVSASVAAHQLHLTDMDLGEYNVMAHVRPPLRSQRDRDGLREGLREGVIDAICSDHQPQDADAKLGPFSATEPGISALETLLPLSLRLVRDGLLTLPQAIARLTVEPARILGLDYGNLAPGRAADVCVFDPEAFWTLRADELASRGKNTPFDGWDLQGRVSYTLLDGRVVYQAVQ